MNIAREYMEQNNLSAAHEYFMLSLKKNQKDPYLLNEVAVYYYKNEEYEKSRDYLHDALRQTKKYGYSKDDIWEKLWCNLGHVYRHPP